MYVYVNCSIQFSVRICTYGCSAFRRKRIHGVNVQVKVKVTVLQALRLYTGLTAHSGSRGIALSFLDHGTRRGEGSASRPGRYLSRGKTQCPLYRRLAGPLSRSGQVGKISPPPGFDPRTVQPVVSRYTNYTTQPTNMWCT
jgi:hypothetical protein